MSIWLYPEQPYGKSATEYTTDTIMLYVHAPSIIGECDSHHNRIASSILIYANTAHDGPLSQDDSTFNMGNFQALLNLE